MEIKTENQKTLSNPKAKVTLCPESSQILEKLVMYHNLLESIDNPHLEKQILDKLRDLPSEHTAEYILEKLKNKEGAKEVIQEFIRFSHSKTNKRTEPKVTVQRPPPKTDVNPVTDTKLHPLEFFWWGGSLEEFYQALLERRGELLEQKEHFASLIEKLKRVYSNFYSSIEEVLLSGHFETVSNGAGAAYFLSDENGKKRYVVKPVDEDIFCMNNRKGLVSIETGYLTRSWVPVYRSAQTDALCSEVAQIIGIPNVTPKTVMAVISQDGFFDFSDKVGRSYIDELIAKGGLADKEKLCSVQEYIPESKDLFEILNQLGHMKLSDEEIGQAFDQADFEEANLFIWTTYDTDGHFGNFRAYIKSIDPLGKEIIGIKKIDNGLAFPEKNQELRNGLVNLPNAQHPLSQQAREKILNINEQAIINRLKFYEMDECIDAFVERIQVLKELAQRDEMSIYEINYRMKLVGKEEVGIKLALSELPLRELKKQVKNESF